MEFMVMVLMNGCYGVEMRLRLSHTLVNLDVGGTSTLRGVSLPLRIDPAPPPYGPQRVPSASVRKRKISWPPGEGRSGDVEGALIRLAWGSYGGSLSLGRSAADKVSW
jgi:hypothetical protein